jgi:hypothetical protein
VTGDPESAERPSDNASPEVHCCGRSAILCGFS